MQGSPKNMPPRPPGGNIGEGGRGIPCLQSPTPCPQSVQNEAPCIRTPGQQEAPAATGAARDRKRQSRAANACLHRRKREPTRAGRVGMRGEATYKPTGAMAQHSRPSTPKAKPPARGHIQRANPQAGREQESGRIAVDGNGPASGKCRRAGSTVGQSPTRAAAWGERGGRQDPQSRQPLNCKAYPRTTVTQEGKSGKEVGEPLAQ